MNLSSVFALGVLATGLAVFGTAQAQPYPQPYYPPANAQAYPPPRPLAPMVADDEDDLPPNLRAAPGNYPAPPGGYVFPDQRGMSPGGVQREASPAPGYGQATGCRLRRPRPQQYPPAYQSAALRSGSGG